MPLVQAPAPPVAVGRCPVNPRRWLTRAITTLRPPAGTSKAGPPRPPSLPGLYPRSRPIPRHNHGHLVGTADVWECGCVSEWRRRTGQWEQGHCWRHEFDTEWEARLSR